MKRKINNSLLVLVLLLAVGFAAVSTSLVINGTIGFNTNEDDFEVIFTKSIIDGIDMSDSTISEDGKSITFVTSNLAILGDTSKLDFVVTNNSTQYDANVEMECVAEGEKSGTYYTINHTLPSVVKSKSIANGTVTATLNKTSVDAVEETFTCTINATAQERTNEEENKIVSLVYDENNDGIADIGDMIAIGTEQFYVTSNDGTNIKMLARYNLNVGNICTDTNTCTPIENPTGIQTKEAIGRPLNAKYPYYGVTPYSSDEQKGTNYTDYEGSIVEKYVSEYKNLIFINYNIEVSATLITGDELISLGCSKEKMSCMTSIYPWVYSTSYWTKTVDSGIHLIRVYSSAYSGSHYYTYSSFGVRPLITISADLLK